jgi:hypothetical protein
MYQFSSSLENAKSVVFPPHYSDIPMGENTNLHKVFVRKAEGNMALGRYIHRWKNKIVLCMN